jgi:hypothetical protein
MRDNILTTIGIIVILAALLIIIFSLFSSNLKDKLTSLVTAGIIFGCIGFGIIFHERLIEIPIPGVGTIKTATQQTVEDAKFVKETRDTVLAQGHTIGLVAQKANELSTKIDEADKLFNIMKEKFDESIRQLEVINHEQENIKGQIKDFQGFLEESKNNLQGQIEALHPYRQIIVTGHVTVQVAVKSDEKVRQNVHGQ